MPEEYTVKLISVEKIDPETIKARFEKPQGFTFEAGQFVMIGVEVNKKKAYSIASSPHEEYLELCVKVHNGGAFSPLLAEATPGDSFIMKGPFGKFSCKALERETLFIATGTGIAPIISMIKCCLASGSKEPIVLAYGFRHQENFLYKEEIEALATQYENFSYKAIMSQPPEGYQGEKGHVQDLINDYFSDGVGKDAYMCGSPAMIKDVFALVKDKGYNPHREMW